MKRFISILMFFVFNFSFYLYADKIDNIYAIFINKEGYALTSYQNVVGKTSIQAVVNYKTVDYEVIKYDFLNDFAVIKPLTEGLEVQPVSLGLTSLKEDSKVFVPFIENNKTTVIEGKISSLSGTKGDIRHFKVNLNSTNLINSGIVFNDVNSCIGFISGRVTDIYALIQPEEGWSANVVLSKKIDYLFTLLKDIDGVVWEDREPKEGDVFSIENAAASIITLNTKGDKKETSSESLTEFKSQIPKDALFMYVTVSSGFDNAGFSSIILEELQKNQIGNTVPPVLKQNFYKSIFEKYGQSDLSAVELVKMAADLADGYFMEIGCNIIDGDNEDNITIKLYEKYSMTLLADIYTSKLINLEPIDALKELAAMAVTQLKKELSSKKPSLILKN